MRTGRVTLREGDCRDVMLDLILEGVQVDAIVTDPPYHLSPVKRFGKAGAAPAKSNGPSGVYKRASAGFMGQAWDGGDIAFDPETWGLCLNLLRPGGHLLAFSGTRTYHRMACAIEDAGFEIRDQIGWAYGSGFPKSLNVSKAIDKMLGYERKIIAENPNHRAVSGVSYEGVYAGGNTGSPFLTAPGSPEAAKWEGWGTALKPAWEPIVVARKPLSEKSVAANVLAHGTGALNIDECRVPAEANRPWRQPTHAVGGNSLSGSADGSLGNEIADKSHLGRYPANLIHDGSDEVLALFPDSNGSGSARTLRRGTRDDSGWGMQDEPGRLRDAGTGSAARFFYCPKASKKDRAGSKHPTVKPIDLMRYLCRLVTPPGGTVLDPFAGSGTTGQAAVEEGFRAILIEREAEYIADIRRRLGLPTSDSFADGIFA